MFFDNIFNSKNRIFWTCFHIALGAACTYTPYALVAWVYLVVLTNIFKGIVRFNRGSVTSYLGLLVYLVSYELLVRMTKAYPYLPSEAGKYFMIFFSLVAIFIKGIKSIKGLIMFLLLTPALFIDESGQVPFVLLIYNVFGPLALALGIAAFSKTPIWQTELNNMLRLVWLTALSTLIFTVLKTPDLSEIEFHLGSNFQTTADMSSNQVSTIFGLGMFLTFYSLIKKQAFSGHYLFDLAIFLLFLFQGLLTFSRGGMLVGAVCMLMVFLYGKSGNMVSNISRGKKILYGSIAIISMVFIVTIANEITGGNLFLRYQGETEGTLRGTKEVDINQFTTGRSDIFLADVELWLDYPVFGVGGSASPFLRPLHKGVSPHVELSRLLAEHGILGVLFFIILLLVFLEIKKKSPPNMDKGLFYALFLMAFLTTFHAAMRTYVSTLFFIFASMYVFPDENVVREE
jgi:hypothetical protein